MSYSRLEINLMPSELQPGPAVRLSLLISILFILALIAYCGIDAYLGWSKLQLVESERIALQAQIDAREHILGDYNELVIVGDKITRRGRLIAMASIDYIDLPVLLDRIAYILPDSVYIDSIANQRSSTRGGPVNLILNLKASEQNPELILSALRALKGNELFADCFLANVLAEEESLKHLMMQYDIDWDASGVNVPANIIAEQYVFQIAATLQRPFGGIELSSQYDETDQMSDLDEPAVAPKINPSTASMDEQPNEESELIVEGKVS